MSLIINNNTAATNAANNLSASNAQLQSSLNKLSSGSRIVKASDDAGGLAAAMSLSSAALNAGSQVSKDADQVSYLQTVDGVLQVAGSILTRMSQLASLTGDATMSTTDQAGYSTEFSALQTELGSTGLGAAEFNGTAMFGTAGVVSGVSALSITDAAGIATALAGIASARASNGAAQSVAQFDSQVQTVTQTNLQAAASQLSNVDVAAESTNLAKWNVLVQYGAAMLAQANQTTQVALKLIQ